MKILLIGGTGHIGRFLTPMLVREGYEVTVLNRGKTVPEGGVEWDSVNMISGVYQRNSSDWQNIVSSIEAEVVIDIIGADVPELYKSIKGSCKHLICCGSVWMFGEPRVVPTPEIVQNECIVSAGYAKRFSELEDICSKSNKDGVAFTAIMPSNICGPGKIPLDTAGGRSLDVHKALLKGEEVILPYPGNNLIAPCDAEDISRAFVLAIKNRDIANGEFFNVGPKYALTMKQLVETFADIYKQNIPIKWVGYKEFITEVLPSSGANYHFIANMYPDLSKIKEKLGYAPEYTSEESLARAISWMKEEGLL